MSLFDEMVNDFGSSDASTNAVHEVMQQIALAGLARGGFFNQAAFYGGTCLHLFHGLDRFSEDLDFSLLEPNPEFDFEKYFEAVKDEFRLAGKEVEIKLKRKAKPTSIESAFLKESSAVFDIGFTIENQPKVKLEVDIRPPLGFNLETMLLMKPSSCWIKAYDLPSLFAGKLSAALFRSWHTRTKGRDWYDVEWYVRNRVKLNFAHFVARGRESDPSIDVSTREAMIAAFDRRIDAINVDDAKADVLPFVFDANKLSIWSRDYFKALIRNICCSGDLT